MLFFAGFRNKALTRIKFDKLHVGLPVGATYLLGKFYVITEQSPDVLVYTGRRPFDFIRTIHVDGMIAVDIATCYVKVCVYILDNGNGRVLRIDQAYAAVDTYIGGLKRGSLISMSVNIDGRLTIVQKNSKILTCDVDKRSLVAWDAPVTGLRHAVEVHEKSFIVCDGMRCEKITCDRKVFCRQDEIGCRYVDRDRDGNLIACDWSGHKVVKLNPETLHVTATLLTLYGDGIESPRHVRCVLDNGLFLVSWQNYLDVYSFDENATQGYLQSQLICEANELHQEITQSKESMEVITASGMDFIFRELPPDTEQCIVSGKPFVGKNSIYFYLIIHLRRYIII